MDRCPWYLLACCRRFSGVVLYHRAFWFAIPLVAAFTDTTLTQPNGDCSVGGLLTDAEQSICHQFQAMEAFSWLNWLILWGWTFVLLVFSVIALSRGNRSVWTAPAGQTDFFARGNGTQVPPVKHEYDGSTYPPQPQYGAQPQHVQPQYTGQPAQPGVAHV